MKKSLLLLFILTFSGLVLAGCSRQQGISVTAPAESTPVQTSLSSPSPLPTATDLTSLEKELDGLALDEETFQ